MRIVILGPGGAGKSRLARLLAARTGAALISLDAIWPRFAGDVAAFRAELARLHEAEAWVSDGNFAAATFDIRLPRATQIVWLEPSRFLCAVRAVRRALTGDPDHSLRKLPDVLRFIRDFERVNRPRIEALRREHGPDVPVVRLRNDYETERWLASLRPHPSTSSG